MSADRRKKVVIIGGGPSALTAAYWLTSTDELRANWRRAAEWTPRMDAETRDREYKNWLKAVDRTMGWIDDES